MRRRAKGNAILETAIWLPVLFLLIVGTIRFAKITYLYYSLNKIVYNVARQISVDQGVNFCDPDDPTTQGAINAALTDPNTQQPLISNLTSDMFQVTTTCLDSTGAPTPCDLSSCGTAIAAPVQPAFVTVSLPGGYPISPGIPYTLLSPISLAPSVTVPFGGSTL
ncbi:MAG TPA: TadE/TadG family type IV pilus assembly protein [Bryobacteraceae bacterium]|nr:TadE/TadG family type IV pilus assembly protein [Bryobacteraceae bacterium]